MKMYTVVGDRIYEGMALCKDAFILEGKKKGDDLVVYKAFSNKILCRIPIQKGFDLPEYISAGRNKHNRNGAQRISELNIDIISVYSGYYVAAPKDDCDSILVLWKAPVGYEQSLFSCDLYSRLIGSPTSFTYSLNRAPKSGTIQYEILAVLRPGQFLRVHKYSGSQRESQMLLYEGSGELFFYSNGKKLS